VFELELLESDRMISLEAILKFHPLECVDLLLALRMEVDPANFAFDLIETNVVEAFETCP
jgi:hypothetical protein